MNIVPIAVFFGLSIFAFVTTIILLQVFLCLWTYHDAKEKSEQDPTLWVLAVLFLTNGIGLLVYFLVGRTKKDVPAPGKFKKALIAIVILFVLSTGFFIGSTIAFAGSMATSDSFFSSATMNRGVWSGFNSNYRNGTWTEATRSGNGTSRRTFTLNEAEMQNFHVDNFNEEGEMYLLLEQDGFQMRTEITGDFFQVIDLNENGFLPGRIRITLEYDRVRNSQTIINWR